MNERERKISEITTLIQAIEIFGDMIAEKTAEKLVAIFDEKEENRKESEAEDAERN